VHQISELEDCYCAPGDSIVTTPLGEPVLSTVASRGRHTRSNPHLPLATPEADAEAVRRKGKRSAKEVSVDETGNTPSPSVKTPFSYSQLPSRPFSEVSRSLNFGSVPAEFSPPGLVSEREILVTPPPWRSCLITDLLLKVSPPLLLLLLLHREKHLHTQVPWLSLCFLRCLLQESLFRHLPFILLLLRVLLYLISLWLVLIPLRTEWMP
jgi:hypothetical protein